MMYARRMSTCRNISILHVRRFLLGAVVMVLNASTSYIFQVINARRLWPLRRTHRRTNLLVVPYVEGHIVMDVSIVPNAQWTVLDVIIVPNAQWTVLIVIIVPNAQWTVIIKSFIIMCIIIIIIIIIIIVIWMMIMMKVPVVLIVPNAWETV